MSRSQALRAPINVDDHLSTRNFSRIAAHIYERVGIIISENKRTMVESRLRRRLPIVGADDLDEYCDKVFSGELGDGEDEHLINAITTNKTDFFREPKHFDYMMGTILPDLVKQGSRKIKVWSAACSTGAEPYTIAMLLDEALTGRGTPSFAITATDIDTKVLETARRGIYEAELVEPVSDRLRRKYVMVAKDAKRREIRMAPKLRSAIAFGRMNLMDSRFAADRDHDMIFCRNVLIYFNKVTQEAVVRRLCDHIKPGGHLFLGHAESILGFDVPLTQVANTVFRRN
ncbi:protein-glutamate O-methyltransferase CheR [Novosphingobium sp. PS1R-30]|uniref:Chemotaxis protein methyltransferase n=1 Tax=Novosphingobium anseongense TaxID=3133436 RepID=A0ABU8RQD8_9SPHN|nr:MAG: protein-glutamate O-methyltransferase CheR [Novosphingobium sp.]